MDVILSPEDVWEAKTVQAEYVRKEEEPTGAIEVFPVPKEDEDSDDEEEVEEREVVKRKEWRRWKVPSLRLGGPYTFEKIEKGTFYKFEYIWTFFGSVNKGFIYLPRGGCKESY